MSFLRRDRLLYFQEIRRNQVMRIAKSAAIPLCMQVMVEVVGRNSSHRASLFIRLEFRRFVKRKVGLNIPLGERPTSSFGFNQEEFDRSAGIAVTNRCYFVGDRP